MSASVYIESSGNTVRPVSSSKPSPSNYCTKLMVAVGVIILIGSLVASGVLFKSLGPISLTIGGAGIIAGVLLFLIYRCHQIALEDSMPRQSRQPIDFEPLNFEPVQKSRPSTPELFSLEKFLTDNLYRARRLSENTCWSEDSAANRALIASLNSDELNTVCLSKLKSNVQQDFYHFLKNDTEKAKRFWEQNFSLSVIKAMEPREIAAYFGKRIYRYYPELINEKGTWYEHQNLQKKVIKSLFEHYDLIHDLTEKNGVYSLFFKFLEGSKAIADPNERKREFLYLIQQLVESKLKLEEVFRLYWDFCLPSSLNQGLSIMQEEFPVWYIQESLKQKDVKRDWLILCMFRHSVNICFLAKLKQNFSYEQLSALKAIFTYYNQKHTYHLHLQLLKDIP